MDASVVRFRGRPKHARTGPVVVRAKPRKEHTCRPCGRCDALVVALAREQKIHEAERKVTRVLAKLPPERRTPVLRAAMMLLGLDTV